MESLGLGNPAGGNTERASPAGGNGAPATNKRATAEPEAVLLVNAHIGFNKLSRKAMLWTVRNLWPGGARFAFNCYCHVVTLFLRRPMGEAETLLSKEGIT